ncbi:MAG: DUF4279 domain-containing protein [Oscillochloridaceae bacterium umkhey_bin13]
MTTKRSHLIAKVEFAVIGETLVPDGITAMLGIPPTRSFMKGDIVSPRPGGQRPWGLWALHFQGNDIQEIAVQLLDALRGKEAAIRTLHETPEVEATIGIWWEPRHGYGGFSLSSATLAQLCALGTRIDVYFPGYQEPGQDT